MSYLRHAFRPTRPSHSVLRNSILQLACLGLLSTLCLSVPSHAAAADEAIPNPDVLAQLELRASQANPREQVFLYTQLVHTMTKKAGKEIADGDTEQAAATLKQVNLYAHIIHVTLARNAKKLKDAEELMHNATYRLAQVLHLASGPDRAPVQETLKQLDQVNDEILAQVFTH
ncbi:MAG: hypothetical protein M3O31_12070 [Acidobacteriota bacterium]|nr:hypothetical protein [Acidobacteriota bacterium]